MKTPGLDEVLREYIADGGSPEVAKEAKAELLDVKRMLEQARGSLAEIKTGAINIPPEKSYGDWTQHKIKTLREAQEYASKALEYKPRKP